MSSYTPTVKGTGVKARVQRLGGHLASMVMPNIGAFIAWGLITALFIPTGWLPNETLAQLVDPMKIFLLPLLIGFAGGKLVYDLRGGVVGAVATVGVAVGAVLPKGTVLPEGTLPEDTHVPMFLGAMLIGPLAAYLMKHVDRLFKNRIKPGFEMLIDNFSAGILGGAMAVVGLVLIGPVVLSVTLAAGNAVQWLIDHSLLPLVSILVEPAKVLFLNNAINHGVFTPMGGVESGQTGQSIMYMIESNPGPGFGLLLAFMFFGPRKLRPTVPAAATIQFLGGIHEIYFPYVLMKPRLLLAVIAGGMSGVATFMVTGAGLAAPPSPGSIFAYAALIKPDNWFGTLAGIVVATGVSFLVAALLLGFGRKAEVEEDEPETPEPAEVPAARTAADTAEPEPAATTATVAAADIRKIIVACDAGMGSSVMLASQLRKQLKDDDVSVEHTPVASIPSDADVIVCHAGLAERVRSIVPDTPVIPIQVFLGDPAVRKLVETIKKGGVVNA